MFNIIEELNNAIFNKQYLLIAFFSKKDLQIEKYKSNLEKLKKKYEWLTIIEVYKENFFVVFEKYEITKTPTLIIFKNREEIEKINNFTLLNPLEKILNNLRK